MKQQSVQPRRPERRKDTEAAEVAEAVTVRAPDGHRLAGVDQLLDDIDAALEAQAAVNRFRQRPGE